MLRVMPIGRALYGLFWLLIVPSVRAELQALDDEALRTFTGQAYVAIDQNRWDDRDYVRVNLGMTIKTQLNVDKLTLGEYPRYENGGACAGCSGLETGLEQNPADIMIDNFSLGTIAEKDGIASDGQFYRKGEIVPFTLIDPYLEYAIEPDGTPVGVRMGFKGAQGTLGGEILSLTGNLPVEIRDTASALRNAPNRPWWIDLAGAILGRTPVASQAELVRPPVVLNGQSDYSTGGTLDPVRASWVGIPDGAPFSIGPIFLLGTIHFNTDHCNLFGIPTCFPLTNFKSINIGERQRDDTYKPVEGLFASFQTKAMSWYNPENAQSTPTTQGAFLNIPEGGVQLTLDEAFSGLPRQRVEYIDRGVGLF